VNQERSQADADHEAITELIAAYVSVTDEKNHDAIARAFHDTATLLSVSQGRLRQMSQDEWWSRVSTLSGNPRRAYTVPLLDIVGLAAVARVDFATSSDYLILLKLDGTWKIVQKTLSVEV
jgi:hypothetical protein